MDKYYKPDHMQKEILQTKMDEMQQKLVKINEYAVENCRKS